MQEQQFPFGIEFQQSLIRLMIDDPTLTHVALHHLKPEFFENEVLSWAWQTILVYYNQFNTVPTFMVLEEEIRRMDQNLQGVYAATIDQVKHADLKAEDWIRERLLKFIHRNIFVKGFNESRNQYNRGDMDAAFDHMERTMDQIRTTVWNPPDRSFLFDEFEHRYSRRLSADPLLESVPTGIPEIDQILGGGLSKGELGAWLAYAKRGKSTMLVNLGAQAVRRGDHKVLHFVLEGSRQQTENRYDTFFSQLQYNDVKVSNFSREVYDRMMFDYRMYSQKMVLRAFTSSEDDWDCTIKDLWTEINELKRIHRFVPDLIIVDYGDLLRARSGVKDGDETGHQTAGWKDLKSLANRGYAVWSASQAQRPKNDPDVDEQVLQVRNISYAYAKIQVADFFGSINQTLEERHNFQARLFAEIYRDNEASRLITVKADLSRMTFTTVRLTSDQVLPNPSTPPLGYTQKRPDHPLPVQQKVPV